MYSFDYDFKECPDIAQTLACTCAGLSQPFCFTGLQTLKVKETNRTLALKNELKKLGGDIAMTDTSITGISFFNPFISSASISTYDDHRMAMSFAPLCLLLDHLIIENAQVVSKSYPLFWEQLKQIGINTKEI